MEQHTRCFPKVHLHPAVLTTSERMHTKPGGNLWTPSLASSEDKTVTTKLWFSPSQVSWNVSKPENIYFSLHSGFWSWSCQRFPQLRCGTLRNGLGPPTLISLSNTSDLLHKHTTFCTFTDMTLFFTGGCDSKTAARRADANTMPHPPDCWRTFEHYNGEYCSTVINR